MSQPPCANPLLLSWGVTSYKHAYSSLKACPISFEHRASLQQLKGFGSKCCERLTENLRAHCEEHGLAMPRHVGAKKRNAIARQLSAAQNRGDDDAEDEGEPRPAKQSKEAQAPHCDASFTALSDPTKSYVAWNSMKTLFMKELVYERGRPLKRYALTDEGWEKVWNTPHELVKALEACGPGEEGKKRREELVSSRLNHLVGRKRIPKTVSKALAEVWGQA
ncbi:hypothetical protein VTJ83DRAFT_2348 [Remersonia thermophila]|uniref:Crossover junction endonuclease MUS81 n=1 Tax=Remersonia thermophila TaxID=72144 RepID=A0ABR4DLI0_9PEZI